MSAITTDHFTRVRVGDQIDPNKSLKCHARPMTTRQAVTDGPASHHCVICDMRVEVDPSGRISDIRIPAA
ncbi:hypothetical protein SAM23877_p010 (plasmid) [Streptomyces ambofaciens ATCC 23877]|uniref:Uncharacterized protein n=1 Tax=Streptomyces ambofaciens (strain ATCC 23877 / 3486 / DSM 40053 / JCM 4204 / NBRC 12836 / NRRL B-2516) TaxID=278992 RepID=A0A0K2B607_STRA7|nr:hypothetical protein [Streptomyces ambofaciens]AKZ60719.1 hypothetical protein SAM23877_p010 [Streptomyces ambofaciens ATCC 23877]